MTAGSTLASPSSQHEQHQPDIDMPVELSLENTNSHDSKNRSQSDDDNNDDDVFVSPRTPSNNNNKEKKKKKKYSLKAITSMEWAILPKPQLPPQSQYYPVEKFVTNAVQALHFVESDTTDPSEHEANKSALLGYKAIMDLLRKRDDIEMLIKVLLALRTSGNGNTMGKICSERTKHAHLIHLIFRLNPFDPQKKDVSTFDSRLVDAYLNLILALVSANSVFLTPALNALWRHISNTEPILPDDCAFFEEEEIEIDLVYTEQDDIIHSKSIHGSTTTTPTSKQGTTQPSSTSKEQQELYQSILQRNIKLHATLSKVLQLVPKGRTEIFTQISLGFPFKLKSIAKHICYIKQCLIVMRYVPTIQKQFLELCMDRCLEIDVEIRIAKDGIVQIDDTPRKKDREYGNDDDMNGGGKDDHGNDEEIAEIERLQKEKTEQEKIDEMADKLDFFMLLIFQQLKSFAGQSKKAPRQLYKMVVPAFESVILTTHRSKYVQFIIPFLCGLDDDALQNNDNDKDNNNNDDDDVSLLDEDTDDMPMEQPKLYREFAAKLIDVILDPYRATVTRQSAACYLASFISRGTFICAETACEAVAALLRFADAYMENYPTVASSRKARRSSLEGVISVRSEQVQTHSLFYTVCQAAFYIMCFRGKECIHHYKNALSYHSKLEEERMEDGYNSEDEESWVYSDPVHIDISGERWTKLCSHHLQVLRYCLESVRGEFLLLCDTFGLMDDDLLGRLIVEDRKMSSSSTTPRKNPTTKRRFSSSRSTPPRRKSISIQTAATLEKKRLHSGVGGLGRGTNPLDSFFPFDPYLLRRSYNFVERYYRQWDGSAVADTLTTEEKEKILTEEVEMMTCEDEQSDYSSDGDDDDDNCSDEDESDDENNNEEKNDDDNGPLSMSLTSNTSMMEGGKNEQGGGIEIDNSEIVSNRESWVHELKRARALSVGSECW